MKDVLKSIMRGIIKVFIMTSIIHSGATIIMLLILKVWNANSIVTVGCLLGGVLTIIAVLVISYFVANMLVEEQGSKVGRIFLRPLCLIFVGFVLYFLLVDLLYI